MVRGFGVMLMFWVSLVLQGQMHVGAQSIIRSTFSVSTPQPNQHHALQHSLGQSVQSNDYVLGDNLLSQGYLQSRFAISSKQIERPSKPVFEVYPNPFITEINLSFLAFNELGFQLEIYNQYGQLLQRLYFGAVQQLSLHLEHLPPGNYTIRLRKDDEIFHKKIIKLT